jgi:hypothetical protein
LEIIAKRFAEQSAARKKRVRDVAFRERSPDQSPRLATYVRTLSEMRTEARLASR